MRSNMPPYVKENAGWGYRGSLRGGNSSISKHRALDSHRFGADRAEGSRLSRAWLADLLTSPVVPLVIAITAIALVFEGRKEKHETNAQRGGAGSVTNDARVSDSGNATATARVGDIYIGTGPATAPRQHKRKTIRPLFLSRNPKMSLSPILGGFGLSTTKVCQRWLRYFGTRSEASEFQLLSLIE